MKQDQGTPEMQEVSAAIYGVPWSCFMILTMRYTMTIRDKAIATGMTPKRFMMFDPLSPFTESCNPPFITVNGRPAWLKRDVFRPPSHPLTTDQAHKKTPTGAFAW